MLNEQEIKKIKEQITAQIKSWQVPEEQKQQAISQVESMNSEQLEQFLIQNKLIKSEQSEKTATQQTQENQCPFCLISENKIPSYKIDENSKSIAILEINPLTKGHTIIIPKKHQDTEKIPSQAFTLAKKISKKLKSKLKADNVEINASSISGHGFINVMPFYKNQKPTQRKKAEESELKKLQEKLITKKREIKPKTKKSSKKPKKLEKAPVRVP